MSQEKGIVNALGRGLCVCMPREEGCVPVCFGKRAWCSCASERELVVCEPRKEGFVNVYLEKRDMYLGGSRRGFVRACLDKKAS